MHQVPTSETTRLRLARIERFLMEAPQRTETVPAPVEALQAPCSIESPALVLEPSLKQAQSTNGPSVITAAAMLSSVLALLGCLVGLSLILHEEGFGDGMVVAAVLGLGGLLLLLVPQPLLSLASLIGLCPHGTGRLRRWAMQVSGGCACLASTGLLWMLS